MPYIFKLLDVCQINTSKLPGFNMLQLIPRMTNHGHQTTNNSRLQRKNPKRNLTMTFMTTPQGRMWSSSPTVVHPE
jgi:hypothetical protein